MNTVKAMLAIALAVVTLSVLPREAQASPSDSAIANNNLLIRDARLRSQIAADLDSGALSPSMANNLISQLNLIRFREQSAVSLGGLDQAHIAVYDGMYNAVDDQVNDASTQPSSNAIVSSYQVAPWDSSFATWDCGFDTPVPQWEGWRAARRDADAQLDSLNYSTW